MFLPEITADTPDEDKPTETTYAYNNARWRDQLTAYDGKTITYDPIGNPQTIGSNALTWENGRKLATLSFPIEQTFSAVSADVSSMTVSYTLGSDGDEMSLDQGDLYSTGTGYSLADGVLSVSGTQLFGEQVTLGFTYDASGLRTQKTVTVDNVRKYTTDYFLHGKLLMELKEKAANGSIRRMHFYYDAASKPQMMKYNGNYYTYIHNLQ